jgi:hypothetical protein
LVATSGCSLSTKEVVFMKYEKPTIVAERAISTIQGNDKHGGVEDVIPSTPAYEADE